MIAAGQIWIPITQRRYVQRHGGPLRLRIVRRAEKDGHWVCERLTDAIGTGRHVTHHQDWIETNCRITLTPQERATVIDQWRREAKASGRGIYFPLAEDNPNA